MACGPVLLLCAIERWLSQEGLPTGTNKNFIRKERAKQNLALKPGRVGFCVCPSCM